MKKIILIFSLLILFQSHQASSTDIIEQALTFKLAPTDTITCEQARKIGRDAYKKVEEADYQAAVAIILEGLQKSPSNFRLQIDFGTIVGDYADTSSSLSEKVKEMLRTKSKNCLEKLMTEVDGQPKNLEFYLKNEYGWRFRQHKYQYENGLARIAYYWGTPEFNTIGYSGYYCQGVGAAHYAKELLKNGDKQSAKLFAQKSLVAWAQYFSYSNDYYNAYVHYALALGILGYKDEMIKALQKSADIIKTDLNYHEFKEIIDFINSLEN